jgi:ABC-type transport system involved in multi-copper enzyme maturation permease subunit
LGPIFAREWLTVPRRASHYVTRSAYYGLLWVLGLTAWQAIVGWSRPATLGDNARFGLFLFAIFSWVQLALLLFFSALTSASAISLEKDRRTFILLLLTDLRSYEIVLGKLLGSLLQIVLLLLGVLPVLALLLLMGGISPAQIGQAGLIMAATALAAGSVGTVIALWREKTFQTLALTVLFLVLYLCLVRALPELLSRTGLATAEVGADWQQWLEPFYALRSVLESSADATVLRPAYGFALVMLGVSVVLNAWGIVRLRVWNPSGEPIMQREQPDENEDKDRARAHAAPGAVREVWANPILWREIRTRAYGRRMLIVKAAYFLVLGLIGFYALSPLWGHGGRDPFAAAYGLVPIGILSVLLVSAQAVTAITSERDGGALDLLLVTDLSPQEFIFGKLWGILYNTKEYLLPPLVLAVVYAAYGWLASPPAGHPELLAYKNNEAAFCVIFATLVVLSFSTVLGIHVALHNINSRVAILNTLATVFFLSVGTLVCIYLILINGRFEYQWTSFLLFIAAGIGGLVWVLCGERPSSALLIASWLCPIGILYTVMTILVGKPGSEESVDPMLPFLVTTGCFGFTVAAMLVPLLSEFDVALGRTTGPGE